FARITRFGALPDALAGVDAALEAGLEPVKINVVVARGMNEDEIGDFVAWTERAPVHVRFIELMPMGETGFYALGRRVGLAELMERAGELAPVAAADRPAGSGPAAYFRRPGARGTVGFISAVSCGFCASCNRVRLDSGGRLVPCLDGDDGTDLAGPLRRGAGSEELQRLIREAVRAKPPEHSMRERAAGAARWMCGIGG
ncbi:MAG: GTP 3',8-cyclase MoaA, partial [Elusimicrobia bacterium]|nr:GTP 3',8-cyclase MoaA [Elusimicrobiota bacterium]